MNTDLKLTEGIAPEEEETLLAHLRAYNVRTFGSSDRRDLAIPLYDDKGRIVGGLSGYTGRGWLYVAILYVPQEMRGQRLAARMLDMAETEARARGCIGAYIDTMNPEALGLYQRLGYTEIGKLNGLAGGYDVTWLEKRF